MVLRHESRKSLANMWQQICGEKSSISFCVNPHRLDCFSSNQPGNGVFIYWPLDQHDAMVMVLVAMALLYIRAESTLSRKQQELCCPPKALTPHATLQSFSSFPLSQVLFSRDHLAVVLQLIVSVKCQNKFIQIKSRPDWFSACQHVSDSNFNFANHGQGFSK
jgi:hypothetical protein